jgi:hypothetical protein
MHLYNRFHQTGNNSEDNSYAIWIDTLCIPVSPQLLPFRNKAIGLLGRTFSDTTVLVLDRELEALSSPHISVLEQNLHILCSGWMRRLWTLQEGMLARELFIQFRDTAVRLDRSSPIDVGQNIFNNLRSDTFLTYSALEDTINQRIPSVSGLYIPVNTYNRVGSSYKNLISAVRYRSTSKMKDEPLILL